MKYSRYLFDCDGVILNSNSIKEEGFRFVCNKYFPADTEWLLDLHRRTNGISRYVKFSQLVQRNLGFDDPNLVSKLCSDYQDSTTQSLLSSDSASGINEIASLVGPTNMGVISGGDQHQLRYVLNKKGLSSFFQAGIFGSPKDKPSIYYDHFGAQPHDLYLGDSLHDASFAQQCGLDFVFIYSWSSLDSENILSLDYPKYPNILSYFF